MALIGILKGCELWVIYVWCVATVRDFAGFLADGVDSVDEEGTLASMQDVGPSCCCCELATVSFVAMVILDILVKNEARLEILLPLNGQGAFTYGHADTRCICQQNKFPQNSQVFRRYKVLSIHCKWAFCSLYNGT